MNFIFNPEVAFENMKKQFLVFMNSINCKNVVIGISGGKDSSTSAAFCAKVLGSEHVFGIMMPNGVQKDISDSLEVIRITGINSYAIDIKNAYNAILDQLNYNGIKESQNTIINLPPRLRMSVQYAVAQSKDAIVLNNDNLSERILGYSTLWGDSVGSYGLIQHLTVTEVIALGEYLGLPEKLTKKTPGDGLQSLGDEERMGISYAMLDKLIRMEYDENTFPDKDMLKRIIDRYNKNKFKSEMIHLQGPENDYPTYFDI